MYCKQNNLPPGPPTLPLGPGWPAAAALVKEVAGGGGGGGPWAGKL
jgi:hypothetical protein